MSVTIMFAPSTVMTLLATLIGRVPPWSVSTELKIPGSAAVDFSIDDLVEKDLQQIPLGILEKGLYRTAWRFLNAPSVGTKTVNCSKPLSVSPTKCGIEIRSFYRRNKCREPAIGLGSFKDVPHCSWCCGCRGCHRLFLGWYLGRHHIRGLLGSTSCKHNHHRNKNGQCKENTRSLQIWSLHITVVHIMA